VKYVCLSVCNEEDPLINRHIHWKYVLEAKKKLLCIKCEIYHDA
jgi:hypothetical protein